MTQQLTPGQLKKQLKMMHGGDVRQAAAVLSIHPADILDFSTNISPFGLPDGVRFQLLSTEEAGRYPDPEMRPLYAALSEAVGVPTEHLVIGCGASELIDRLMAVLYRENGASRPAVCLPEPTFLEYARAAARAGFAVKPYPLSRAEGFRLDTGYAETIGPTTAAAWICQPNNPTGGLTDPDVVRALLQRCGQLGARLLVDECFLDLLPAADGAAASMKSEIRGARQLVILGSWTKTYAMPGVRLGYLAVGDTDLADRLRRQMPAWLISGQAQQAGLAALKDTAYLARLRAWLPDERAWLREQLTGLGLHSVSGTANYLFFSAPGCPDLRERLLLSDPPILVRSCANYPGLTETDFRVAVRHRSENEQLVSALRRVLSGPATAADSGTAPPMPGGRPKRPARAVMVLGTTSNAGKSFVTAGLCRLFKRMGYRVAPFKAQNMALNSAITPDGLEIGRAQAVQAEACGILPTSDMNPILLKPTGHRTSQVIVNGEVDRTMTAAEYYRDKARLWPVVLAAYERLSAVCDVIVVEGAGSPAEINLRENDFVNAGLAARLNIPCILVGDIDRGGVFASLYGTCALLDPMERRQIKGLLINKFRGDRSILEPGERQIEQLTGIPVIGCLPMTDVVLDDEDSLSDQLADDGGSDLAPFDGVDLAVIRLPRLSNFTDFNVFRQMPGVRLRYVRRPDQLGKPDLILIPGTKSTIDDLLWLRTTGLEGRILRACEDGCPIMGICGGYQMLGRRLSDPDGAEQRPGAAVRGLGLLNAETVFLPRKTRGLTRGMWDAVPVSGYEIHMGVTTGDPAETRPLIRLADGRTDGLSDLSGQVTGTYLHGCFDSPGAAEQLIGRLKQRRQDTAGEPAGESAALPSETQPFDWAAFKEAQYEKLADVLAESIDLEWLKGLIES